MKERRTVEIDGDDFEVKGAGNWFIETDRKRYSWNEGAFRYSPDRTYPPDVENGTAKLLTNRTGREIVLLTLRGCTAGTCWITWSDGMRAVYNAPEIEDVSIIYAARAEMGSNENVGESNSYGQLTVYGDFDSVLFAKVHYDLQDAVNARSILRFLCGCAVGKPNAKSKADIREHVSTVNTDWRPSQDFRNQLKSLFECVGSHRGMYWIKD